jgi:hypothetical protein
MRPLHQRTWRLSGAAPESLPHHLRRRPLVPQLRYSRNINSLAAAYPAKCGSTESPGKMWGRLALAFEAPNGLRY